MKKLCIAFIASLLLFSTTTIALPPTPGQHPSNSPTVVGRSALSVQPIIYQGLDYDAQTGSFTAFNTITGATSGATATIIGIVDIGTTGRLYLSDITGTFQDDEIVYESAEGAELSSGNLTVGVFYKITARTEQDFTLDGSPDNNVGTRFLATGTNVTLDADDKVVPITNAALANGVIY